MRQHNSIFRALMTAAGVFFSGILFAQQQPQRPAQRTGMMIPGAQSMVVSTMFIDKKNPTNFQDTKKLFALNNPEEPTGISEERKHLGPDVLLGPVNQTAPETATTWAEVARKMNLPVSFVKKMDNTKLRETPSLKGVSKFLMDYISKADPNDVAQIADDLNAVDRVYEAFREEAEPDYYLIARASYWLTTHGYAWNSSLDSYTKNGLAVEPEVDPYEGLGDEERRFVKSISDYIKTGLKLEPDLFILQSGATETAKKRALSLMNKELMNEIAVANTLNMHYGGAWRDWDEGVLSMKIENLRRFHGLAIPDVSLENLTKKGIDDVKYSHIFNLFGAMDIAEATELATLPTGEELANIGMDSPLEDQMRKFQMLSILADEQRGLTTSAGIVQGIVEAIPYIALLILLFVFIGGIKLPDAIAEKFGVKPGTKVAKMMKTVVLSPILKHGGFIGFKAYVNVKMLRYKEMCKTFWHKKRYNVLSSSLMIPGTRFVVSGVPTVAPAKLSAIPNHAIFPDTKGEHINAHGGCMLQVGDTYFWYGEHRSGFSLSGKRYGVHLYTSKDLYNWEDKGLVFETTDGHVKELQPGQSIVERPKVIYNEKTKKYVLWFHAETESNYSAATLGVAVSDSPYGPFAFLCVKRPSIKSWPQNLPDDLKDYVAGKTTTYNTSKYKYLILDYAIGQRSSDMTVFVDDDKKAYVIHSSEMNATLHVVQLNDEYTDFTDTWWRIFIDANMGAPVMFRNKGKYCLIGSYCTGWTPNEARFAVADHIYGPWKELGNPAVDEGGKRTYEGQSAHMFTLPVHDGKPGDKIIMFDIWKPGSLINSQYMWLKLEWEKEKPILHYTDRLIFGKTESALSDMNALF